ncbi:hypothetical protein EAF04_010522 [Stromatinia cepivora]|nr:hypothetical protein EAF04_010522 [Stromatinia cepivora]
MPGLPATHWMGRCYLRVCNEVSWQVRQVMCCTGVNINGMLLDINIGYGRHIWDIRALTLLSLLSVTILDTVYVISIYLVKISLLFLFWRFFNVSSKCRQFIYFGFGAITLITIPYFSVSAYRSVNCTSLKAITRAMCRSKNVSTTQIVFGALNTVTDFYILAIPVAMIRKLQIDQKKKISLMVPFLAGVLACIMSIVRLIIVGQNFGSSDSFWNGAVVSQYSTVEMNLAIICSCMVFFPAVIRKSKSKLSATYQYMISRGGSRGYNRAEGSGSSKEINSLEARPVEWNAPESHAYENYHLDDVASQAELHRLPTFQKAAVVRSPV